MIKFLVTVACLHLQSCPIPSPIKQQIQAKDDKQCHAVVSGIIAAYGFESKDFKISCERK